MCYPFESDSSLHHTELPLHLAILLLDSQPLLTAEVIRQSLIDVLHTDTAQVPVRGGTRIVMPKLYFLYTTNVFWQSKINIIKTYVTSLSFVWLNFHKFCKQNIKCAITS